MCVPEVKHLSGEQKEVISGLAAPSQLDVKETCGFLLAPPLQFYHYRCECSTMRSEDACMRPWTGDSTKEAGM